jgi:hypothetical protein
MKLRGLLFRRRSHSLNNGYVSNLRKILHGKLYKWQCNYRRSLETEYAIHNQI